MNHTTREHNGHREHTRMDAFASAARQAKGAIGNLHIDETVRDYPYAAIAIAGGAGLLVGLTVGSRLIRVLVSSVGMFTVSELLRRYARRALDEMVELEVDAEPVPPISEPQPG